VAMTLHTRPIGRIKALVFLGRTDQRTEEK